MPMLQPPVPFSPDVEKPEPDENETSQKLIEAFGEVVRITHEDRGGSFRGVHAKSHALLLGEMTVHPDLSPELAQGVFATPGRTYPVIIRMSTMPGDPIRDSVSLPRGFAIKVIGVEGERLPGAHDENTQDFLLANGPAFGAPNPKKFLGLAKALASTTDKAEGAKEVLSKVMQPVEKALEAVGIKSAAVSTFGGYPATNPIGDRYFSQAPFRHGDYIAKYDVVPESPNFRLRTDQKIDEDASPDAIRELLTGIFAKEGGSWTLRAQLCRDLEKNPIEDASVEWKEDESPFQALATITVAPQTGWSAERSRVVDDQTAFRPWHGVAAHQPLGGINRSRGLVYPVTQQYRSQLSGCPLHEPSQLPTFE